jgi:NAD(P)-dependent dehydrogenase (short-subunit alcohol dehydrogenase family)
MPERILISGASSGFGALAARELARRGHHVFAGMRDVGGRNAAAADELRGLAQEEGFSATAVELDVIDDDSVAAATRTVLDVAGGIDVMIHNAGHMVLGPAEAFTPAELGHLYDVNVGGTQRLNREVLPIMRDQGRGHLLWVGSTSTRGGTPPFLAPYFAAKAAMDALAVSYAAEVIKFGIATTIVVPGAFTSGTSHFQNAGGPQDTERADQYLEHYGELQQAIPARLAALEPPGSDASLVTEAMAELLDRPLEDRPFRIHIDPLNDGAEVVSAVADRMRVEFFRRAGIEELLGSHPSL